MFGNKEYLQKYLVTIKTTEGEQYTTVIETKNAKSASKDLFLNGLGQWCIVIDAHDKYDGDAAVTINPRNICAIVAEPYKEPYQSRFAEPKA